MCRLYVQLSISDNVTKVGEYSAFSAAQNAAHELLRGYYSECKQVGNTWDFLGVRGVVGRIVQDEED